MLTHYCYFNILAFVNSNSAYSRSSAMTAARLGMCMAATAIFLASLPRGAEPRVWVPVSGTVYRTIPEKVD